MPITNEVHPVRPLVLAALCVLGAAPAASAQQGPVVIVPLGDVLPSHVRAVSESLKGEYGVEVEVAQAQPLPKAAWYGPRRRWRADRILERRSGLKWPPHAAKVVFLTDAEISVTKGDLPDWGIGGLGLIGGRACVVSSFLIRRSSGQDGKKLRERLGRLAVHEVGHTLGLPHCGVFACVMNDAKGKLIRSLDNSTGVLCGRCRKVVAEAWED